jgi:class 3 adenylate cyclase/tetratricopeptide (TPR) repeat protein
MNDLRVVEEAIAALERQRAVIGDLVADTALDPLRQKRDALLAAAEGGQRKLVTVLVSDLVGFTELSEQMDPEDLQALLVPYFDAWSEVIAEQEGSVEKYIGDAVVAVFGLARAHEDDPRRAVDAALALRRRLDALNRRWAAERGVELAVRIGIDTGEVLVGAYEERPGMDFVAVGDAVNRASRLQTAAPPEGVLVSADTYRHVRGMYVAREVDPIRLKGVREPVSAVLITEPKPRQLRIPSRGVEGVPTQTVGREGEIAVLQDAYRGIVEEHRPQLVTIEGEAGVGKTRLLVEFDSWLELLPDAVWYLRGRATPAEQHRPFALLRDVVANRLDVADSDSAEVVQARLEQMLMSGIGGPDGDLKARAIGRLLGYRHEPDASPRAISDVSSGPRERALAFLAEYLERLSQVHPVVALLEDLHWADDPSLDALTTILDHLRHAPVLIVASARPSLRERRPHWGEGERAHLMLPLRPLTRRESRTLLLDVLRHADEVPPALLDLVVDTAEGNPFYLEELVKWLVEAGVIDTSQAVWQIKPHRLAGLQVPPTLRAVLQARVDALPRDERTVLQHASVIGRVFWSSAVASLTGQPGGHLQVAQALDRLRTKEVVYRRERSAFADAVEFTFKHAVLRDVTYDSLLRDQRRRLHAAVAQWLEDVTGASGRSEEYAVLIGGHWEQAGDQESAASWLLRGGEAAWRASAYPEAVQLLQQARDLAGPSEPLRSDILLALAGALSRTGDTSAELTVLGELDSGTSGLDSRRRAGVLLARAGWEFRRSHYDSSATLAGQAVRLTDEDGDPALRTSARLWRGRALAWQGRHAAAREALEDALVRARESGDPSLISESLRYLAIVANNVGDYSSARRLLDEALGVLEPGSLPAERASVLAQIGAVLYNQQDYPAARAALEEGLRIFRLAGYRYGEAVCAGNLATIAASQTRLAEAWRRAEEALQAVRQIDDKEGIAINLGLIGDVLRQAGRREQAREALQESIDVAAGLQYHYVRSDSMLLLALVDVDDHASAAAAECARDAVALARSAESKLGECRACVALGWVLREAEEREARQCFQRALELATDLDVPGLRLEATAGLAVCGWIRTPADAADTARLDAAVAGAIAGDLEGMLAPGRFLLATVESALAAAHLRRNEVLAASARWLAKTASVIDDPTLADGFLHDVPANAALAAVAGGTSPGH